MAGCHWAWLKMGCPSHRGPVFHLGAMLANPGLQGIGGLLLPRRERSRRCSLMPLNSNCSSGKFILQLVLCEDGQALMASLLIAASTNGASRSATACRPVICGMGQLVSYESGF